MLHFEWFQHSYHNIIVDDGKQIIISNFKNEFNIWKNNNYSFCQCGNWP